LLFWRFSVNLGRRHDIQPNDSRQKDSQQFLLLRSAE
jgi:hypothetical protein